MALPDPLGLVGVKLGPYVVREPVSEGGVAIIYRGEHESLHSAVAIKVLIVDHVAEDLRPTLEQMFLREAQILSQLRSEDILRALDHGRVVCPSDSVERPYIVVDFLVGRPLSEDIEQRAVLVPRRPYTLQEAVRVLAPIARALGVCHASGIVHRDVNPRNVFLEEDPSSPTATPRAKLIDFGFAKEVHRTEALRLGSVDTTLFARSPDYAAPEHYDREKYGELSETTDIYTFALMLVEMLTLEPPLRGVTDTDLWLATKDESDRPTPNNRGARVSPRVEALFAEALAVDQLKRPQMLSEWWARLEAAASEPFAGVNPASPERGASGPSRPVAETSINGGAAWAGGEETTSRRRLHGGRSRAVVATLVVLGAAVAVVVAYLRIRPLACPAGYADCDGIRGNGCETAIASDGANCGACGQSCGRKEGVACVSGQCSVSTCPAGFADCDGKAMDGCEMDVRTDVANCGGCKKVCGTDGVKTAACVEAKCELTCKAGLGDCDGNAANGCETGVLKDPKNCGRCGVVCETSCTDGLCEPVVLASSVRAKLLTARAGSAYYFDEASGAVERVSAGDKPVTVVGGVSGVTGLAVAGDRMVWATPGGVFARAIAAEDAKPERLASSLPSETPLYASPDGSVAWASRAAASTQKGRHPTVPPDRRQVVVATAAARPVSVECNEWPRAFAADGADVYCCDATTPLAVVSCDGKHQWCTHHDLGAACPDDIALDPAHAYFANDARLLALDRKNNTVSILARRKRPPKHVTLAGTTLYWTEGGDVFRMRGNDAAEPIARRQNDVVALAADETGVYWIARSGSGELGTIDFVAARGM